jgi:import inner membrane translocase subunit TIM23
MSVWDVFTGKKSSKPSTETIASTPTTNFSSAPFDPTSAQDVSSFLGSASLPDASQLHPLAGLNQQTLDYLTLDESTLTDLPGSRSALPSRGWSDDLCYGTGVTYLTALSIGGTWGLIEGLNKTPASAPPKLRLNSVLNSVTRRGPFLGNSAGVVAMVYNGFNSIIGHYRGKHDSANSVVAGALSGMLFKSTRGLKPMVISGGIVATVAGIWAVRYKNHDFQKVRLLTSVPGHKKSPLLTVHFALLNLPIRPLSWAEPLQTAGQQLSS